MAIREGLILTHSYFCNKVLLELDCSIVIEACKRGNLKPENAALVTDILGLRALFVKCSLLWTRREANNAAHKMAKNSLSDNLPYDWPYRPPSNLQRILDLDRPRS